MSTKGSNKVISQKKGNKANGSSVTQKPNSRAVEAGNKGVVTKSRSCGFMRCKRPRFSPVRFVKHLGGIVAEGLRLVSKRIRPSPKISSSSSGRSNSKPFATPVDSHRNAAIEDCIEFINSSASMPRSNSVSANSHCTQQSAVVVQKDT